MVVSREGDVLAENVIPFQFKGEAWEYFQIWIVNISLTILTLGLYSAWAKVRKNHFFYNNIFLDGGHFSYEATPKELQKVWLVFGISMWVQSAVLMWVYTAGKIYAPSFAFIIMTFLTVLTPFFIIGSIAFRVNNTAFRRLHFHFNSKTAPRTYLHFILLTAVIATVTMAIYEIVISADLFSSYFSGIKTGTIAYREMTALIRETAFLYFIFLLVLIPCIPWFDFLQARFSLSNISYGKYELTFHAKVWDFYKVYIIAIVLYFVILAVVLGGFYFPLPRFFRLDSLVFMLFFVVLTFVIFVLGVVKAKRTNMVNGRIMVGQNQLLSSLSSSEVGMMYLGNFLAIILSLGLLYPWVKVRTLRYIARNTKLYVVDLEQIHTSTST